MTVKKFTERLASHPKLLHVLFMGAVVLSQVGIVAADNGMTGTDGP